MISIEDYFRICIKLNILKNSINDNIKMRNITTKYIIYSMIPIFIKDNKEGKISRKYSKIFL